jgi:NAD+ synthase
MNGEMMIHNLVDWIKEKVLTSGCRGVVLGMSGGIDSAVLAVLCHRAFPKDTLGAIMPCHSIAEDKAHAEEVARQFEIPTVEVDLAPIFDALVQMLPKSQEPAQEHMAQANLKARLRMVTLYYLANQRRYLVAGSSNRSEIAIGYFTKYGDGGVDIMPLGNLVKEQVRDLARALKIPRSVIAKPPSAGLWPGQTDEGEMGFSYADLDHYLLTGDAPEEITGKIEAMMAASHHKRAMPPIAKVQF